MNPNCSMLSDPFQPIQAKISEWLNIPWTSLSASVPKSTDRGLFNDVLRTLNAEIGEPALLDWLQDIRFSQFRTPRSNWCLRCASRPATKPEEKLERAIREICGDTWYNQMPVASGFMNGNRKAIDLVHQLDAAATQFRFVELKAIMQTNNVLFAACELIQYALAYCWFRDNFRTVRLCPDSRVVLSASRIEFEVLAPRRYYIDGRYPIPKLIALERTLLRAFVKLGRTFPDMTFRFSFVDFPIDPRDQEQLLRNKVSIRQFASPRPISDLR